MAGPATVVWFRTDLRVEDHPALRAAADRGGAVIPLYVWAPEEEEPWPPGAASRWWLHQSLQALSRELRARGSKLIIRQGASLDALADVVAACRADAVFWNRRYEPRRLEEDRRIKRALRSEGLFVRTFNGALLFEPWWIRTGQGRPYKMFTPFWKTCCRQEPPLEPLPTPRRLTGTRPWPGTLALEALGLEPTVDWAGGIRASWTPGMRGAQQELERFCANALHCYNRERDRPDENFTSRLSPHLHFGEISPRTVWHAVNEYANHHDRYGLVNGAESYLRELGWREFAYHLLFHFPHTPDAPLREEFTKFPWRGSKKRLKAWQKGQTGYPIVDAGMRQLWETGWMHNRVRMIVASFLVKDLLIPWQEGARWFWDTLVDADLANNSLGWQWAAGCGADAAPYFRIFNPVTQGKRYDPGGRYVARYLPELSKLPSNWIHQPWAAPDEVRRRAGVELGRTCPHPIVEHGQARDAALAAYNHMREATE